MDVAVLMGGISNEREISILSGDAVVEGLTAAGHTVTKIIVHAGFENDQVETLHHFDVVFNALHGTFGEDGQIQAILDAHDIVYTGCGAEASRLLMDKVATKEHLDKAGILTPRWFVLQSMSEAGRPLPENFNFPLVVKPANAGSSVDVAIVHTLEEYEKAIYGILSSAKIVLVEEFIQGREMTVGVLGEMILPIVELRFNREFFDYIAKYADDETEYLCPAPISGRYRKVLQQVTKEAFDIFGCRDMVRFDYILDEQGSIYLLEGNTIPGFTSHSLLPMAAGVAGYDFPKVCDVLVTMSERRSAETTCSIKQ